MSERELQGKPTEAVDPAPAEKKPAMTQDASVEQLQQERDKYHDLLLRTKADFDNYQKRAMRDRETERKFALAPLAEEILPAIDNLDRFLASVREESELVKVVAGVRTQLIEGLRRHGITLIPAENQAFDPNLHMAVMQQAAPGVEPNTILHVLEAGYLYHDRVLRPSKVVVSKRDD